jgi:hypothetical protein
LSIEYTAGSISGPNECRIFTAGIDIKKRGEDPHLSAIEIHSTSLEAADSMRTKLINFLNLEPELRSFRRLLGWRTEDYLEETADVDRARNWAKHMKLFPIFEGDRYTKLVAE